mmetsp:Transcript_1871/g.2945  ORF Transcript_1871/g.2945 Transcript_1871/m.2945 type:complete len:156 (+) Transcript_1871:238-705(+)|eukprot:CAMPEP_0195301470 /NCGR_PEP_ID=MMETSP0707-20130614/29363_1 /TAXON_ID=33640 /ORGANISM="Asterionellopsis glacialis, Strain CCMP134" /LENGTH=155 /DNA_ID=CAMNT_0040364419 /DNA_START=233 /DNA_END=700 /DNA_ORIENTATION=+
MLHVLTIEEDPEVAQEYLELLQQMENDQDTHKNSRMAPNLVIYSSAVDAFNKCGNTEGVNHVLKFMSFHEANASANVKPNTVCFNALLDTWTRRSGRCDAAKRSEEVLRWSKAKDSAKHAVAILKQIGTLQERGHSTICPDHVSCLAVVNVWAKI